MSAKPAPKRLPGWAKFLITLAIIVGAGALIFSQLPRGVLSTDLSQIGQGQPALVVARDISFLAGADVMDWMVALEPEFAGSVLFLVAHLGRPEGQAFARRFDARDATLVLLNGDGQMLTIVRAPSGPAQIRELLEQHL